MNILEIIRRNVGLLPEGPYSAGLKSVLRHVEVAHNHLARGQCEQDESAFTDAIYRTNQAFEGSIKEAFRVLANKDPQRTTPFEIEQYLQKNNVFKDRVLAQFSAYRKEWRNPATHDYNLDFDEDEAFLAIISVSAFAKVLVDQIIEKVAFAAVAEDLENKTSETVAPAQVQGPLTDIISSSILSFANEYIPARGGVEFTTEVEVTGALSAYLINQHPSYNISSERRIGDTGLRGDLFVEVDGQKLVVEVKRVAARSMVRSGLRQLETYLGPAGATGGILFTYGGKDVMHELRHTITERLNVAVIAPPAAFPQGWE